jgi:hypothetical protein
MLHDPHAEATGIRQGKPHQSRRTNCTTAIGEGDRARLGQQAKLRELFALAARGNGAVREDGQTTSLLTTGAQQVYQGGIIDRGQRIGKGGKSCDTPSGGGLGGRGYGFAVLVAGLSHGGAHIHEAWAQNSISLGNHGCIIRSAQAAAEIGDQAVTDQEVTLLVQT